MGPRSITFLPRPAEGDRPSKTWLNEIPLTSPRKHPESLAPLWLGTKVWVRGRTKGWGRKCRLPGQRCPGCLVLSARGLGFLPELQESEAIYFHCKTEALEGRRGEAPASLLVFAAGQVRQEQPAQSPGKRGRQTAGNIPGGMGSKAMPRASPAKGNTERGPSRGSFPPAHYRTGALPQPPLQQTSPLIPLFNEPIHLCSLRSDLPLSPCSGSSVPQQVGLNWEKLLFHCQMKAGDSQVWQCPDEKGSGPSPETIKVASDRPGLQ